MLRDTTILKLVEQERIKLIVIKQGREWIAECSKCGIY